MTYTLAELVYKTAREMDVVVEGTATGGGTTSIIDTNDRTEDDDAWINGTAVVIYDAGGAGAAPQWQYSVISDFTSSTDTIALRTTLTAAVAVGDKYAIWKRRYSLQLVIMSINKALQDLGMVPIIDTTTVTFASGQTEYTLPGAATWDLRRIWYQTNTSDSNDNDWTPMYGWDTQYTSTGSASLLVFDYQPPSGHDCKLLYVGQHPELVAYNSNLSETIHPNRIIYRAAYYAFKQKNKDDELIFDKMTRLDAKDLEMQAKYPIVIPKKKNKSGLAIYDDNSNYDYSLG